MGAKHFAGVWKFVRSALVLGVFLGGALPAKAQLTAGTVMGTVTDPSGAAVPGATITIKNVSTGAARTLVSSERGRYEAPNLPVGGYEVSASMAGFQTAVRSGIELTVGRNAVVDLALRVGEVAEAVTVSGEAPLIETTTATVANLIGKQIVSDLPLNNRDLTQLAYLQAGVLDIPNTVALGDIKPGTPSVGGMGSKFSIAGSRQYQSQFLLDGVPNTDYSGSAAGATTGQGGAETIQEFQIIINNYSAEYKSQAGAIVSAVTKSGTNAFHGSLFEFLRNDNLDAANFFDNAFALGKPEFKRNQFGGTLGGPIRRDRLFFFGSYEATREREGKTETARVPSVPARQGILPTRTVTIPPQVRPYLEAWPVPGVGNRMTKDFNDGSVEIAGTRKQSVTGDFMLYKFNYNFANEKAGMLSVTYNFDVADRSFFGVLADTNGTAWESTRHVLSVRHTSVPSPTVVNEFTYGYSFSDYKTDIPIPQRDWSNLSFVPHRTKLMGSIAITDLSIVGYDRWGNPVTQKIPSFRDVLSLTRGNHSLRMGAEVNFTRWLGEYGGTGSTGAFSFDTLESFLLARPSLYEIWLPGGEDAGRNVKQLYFGSFFQDNWNVRPSLTLNLGLRHEFVTVPKEKEGKISNLMHLSDQEVRLGFLMNNPTLKSFSPRIGFAWAPGNRRTALRTGFSIYYDLPGWYQLRNPMEKPYPFINQAQATDTDLAARGAILRFPDAYQTQVDLLGAVIESRPTEVNPSNSQIYRWSLTLERELGANWKVSAGYTGSRSVHLWFVSQPNLFRWQGWPENPPKGTPKFWPAITGTNRLFPGKWGTMRMNSAGANSHYHGFTLNAQKRLTRGLQFQLAYTFSKAISQSDGIGSGTDALPQAQRLMYFWDMELNRGLAQLDVRNNVVTNFSYELSLGANLRGAAGKLVKGWQFNGILTLSDGFPLTPTDANRAQRDRMGEIPGLRPNLIPGGNNNPVLGGPEKYFDTSQFVPSTLGYYGNLGKNTLISPGMATFNGSLFKNIDVTETSRFQFRAEFFNLFNRVNFFSPDVSLFDSRARLNPSAGRITQTRIRARQIQFGLRFIF